MSSLDDLRSGTAVGSYRHAAPAGSGPTASAGFGSPGTDATVKRIDLNDALIRHREATFAMRASGTEMQGAGIADGDVLLVDRALAPQHGQVVIAVVDGELVCRRLLRQGAAAWLSTATESAGSAQTENGRPAHAEGDAIEVWGVVTTVIKSLVD